MLPVETVQCDDLDETIAHYAGLGYRLDMVKPADAPREALLSRPSADDGSLSAAIRLQVSNHQVQPTAAAADQNWIRGRAGMEYRDLVPGRLDGKLIASQIRLTQGGPVPDYVHYHRIEFQMIFCKRGRIRVVYE